MADATLQGVRPQNGGAGHRPFAADRREGAAMSEPKPMGDAVGRDEFFETLLERADAYVDDWDPHTEDVGRTVLRIFSDFERDVRTRLNEVPEKHLLAFLDALNVDRRPPQAARAPVSYQVSPDLDRNVPIPGGTRAIADPPEGDTRQFELPQDGGFEATSARPTDVVAVHPERDRIVDHGSILDGEAATLFEGKNVQSHALYLANESALQLDGGASFTVTIESRGETNLFEETVWEYYGEDETGEEGWHRLEAPSAGPSDAEVGVEALQERLAERSGPDRGAHGDDPVTERTFQVQGEPTVCAVDGVESRWLRCATGPDATVGTWAITDARIHVSSADRRGGLEPDMLLSNDVPLAPEDGSIQPFGQVPHPPVTFFVACQEAFTKPGSEIEIEFTGGEDVGDGADDGAEEIGMGVLDGPPQISWEYWNGAGWTRIPAVSDDTDALRSAGRVTFEVPTDITATTVSGHENVWIRARLVSGNYGAPAYDVAGDGDGATVDTTPDAPVFEDVTVHYERANQPFDAIRRYNNASFSEDLANRSDPFAPFRPLPDDRQTVYFGFDGTLENGPLALFVPVEDRTYPQSFDPGVRWEYCTDPERFEWEKLDVHDQTGGFTERGIVTLTFPSPTRAFDLFDRERHWIRARVTEDGFELDEHASEQADEQSATDQDTSRAEDVSPPMTSERTRSPPTLEGLFMNTQWAYNQITVEDEILGSSDGSHDQSFTCSRAPLIDVTVWVDELSTLSAGERDRLTERRPEATAPEYDSRGELSAFWVRWTGVDDFLDSNPQDRHYVVNRTLGTVHFGNGDTGAIPPGGQDNVKATYTTGGGSGGNVGPETISQLKSSIALVESVSNPAPADGGADIESADTLIERSTNRLKHRDRAVTTGDYEAVAKAEFPELARVTCETESARTERARVRVLVVPKTEREKPVPSMELKHQVRETLAAHAPATLEASDGTDIVVREPGYSEISVTATVAATNVKSVSQLKSRIERRLDRFLHPLEGNEGDGWAFGAIPAPEVLVDVVADAEAVTEVVNFEAALEVGGDHRPLGAIGAQQALPEDTLVCSGGHQIAVTTTEE